MMPHLKFAVLATILVTTAACTREVEPSSTTVTNVTQSEPPANATSEILGEQGYAATTPVASKPATVAAVPVGPSIPSVPGVGAVKPLTAEAKATPQDLLSQSDRLIVRSAQSACERRDFVQFFEAFSRSSVVRQKYGAPQITVSRDNQKTRVNSASYTGFPITLWDNSWVVAASTKAPSDGSRPQVQLVKLDFNYSNTNVARVDWVRARYDGVVGEGDGPGKLVETFGPEGYLLFAPTDTCWQLSDDVVGETR